VTRLRICAAACLLLVAAVAGSSPAFGAVDCSVSSCLAGTVHADDTAGGLGDCDDHGHCASHSELTALGLLLVVAAAVGLAGARGVRPWRTSAPPGPLFVEGLYRPPRFG
jgi:hypothetical protein